MECEFVHHKKLSANLDSVNPGGIAISAASFAYLGLIPVTYVNDLQE